MRAGVILLLAVLIGFAGSPIIGTSAQQTSCTVPADQGVNATQVDLVPAGGFVFRDDFLGFDDIDGDYVSDLMPLTEDQYAEILVPADNAMALRFEMVKGYRYRFCVTFYSDPTEEVVSGPPIADVYLLADDDFDIYRTDYETRMESWWSDGLENIPVEWRDMATWLPFRDVHAYEKIERTDFTTSMDSEQEAFINWFGTQPDANMYLVLDNWNSSRPGNQPQSGMGLIAEVTIEVEERVMLPAITAYAIVCLPPILLIVAPGVLHSRFHSWTEKDVPKEDYTRSMPIVEGDKGAVMENTGDD